MGLIQRSISAGILILFILTVRWLAQDKLSKRICTLLWKLAALRLLLPFYLPLPVFNIFPVKQTVWIEAGAGTQNALMDIAEAGNAAEVFFLSPKAVWIAGMIIAAAVFSSGYIRASRRLRESIPLPSQAERNICNWMRNETVRFNSGKRFDIAVNFSTAKRAKNKKHLNAAKKVNNIRIRMLDTIATPTTFGIVRPAIILPKSMDFTDKDGVGYVLLHEYIHVRNRDNLWKLIMAAALCMHWFNPLAAVLYLMFSRDMELACDEKVICSLEEAKRQQYAMTLLSLAEKNSSFQMLYSGFGKNAVSERIKAIMNYRKATAIGTICAVLLLMGGTMVFVSAKESRTKEENAVLPLAATVKEEVTKSRQPADEMQQSYDFEKTMEMANVSIYFNEELTEAVKNKMDAALAEREEVETWGYISAESAWEEFQKEYLDDMDVKDAWGDENPLKDSASCAVYVTGNADALVNYLESMNIVRHVNVAGETVYTPE